jgi:hypothetical protein
VVEVQTYSPGTGRWLTAHTAESETAAEEWAKLKLNPAWEYRIVEAPAQSEVARDMHELVEHLQRANALAELSYHRAVKDGASTADVSALRLLKDTTLGACGWAAAVRDQVIPREHAVSTD